MTRPARHTHRPAARRSVRYAVVMLAAGLLLAAGAVHAFEQRSALPRAFGSTPTSATDTTSTSASRTPATPKPSAARHTASAVARPAAITQFAPSRISVPALAVDAAVVPVLSQYGQLQPPDDPRQVGWWEGSGLAGSTTAGTVLVGHVDTEQSGPGALFRLSGVSRGMTIELSDQGRNLTYQVRSLAYYTKSSGLPRSVFTGTGGELTLITCGGAFDKATGSYLSNVVVRAVRNAGS